MLTSIATKIFSVFSWTFSSHTTSRLTLHVSPHTCRSAPLASSQPATGRVGGCGVREVVGGVQVPSPGTSPAASVEVKSISRPSGLGLRVSPWCGSLLRRSFIPSILPRSTARLLSLLSELPLGLYTGGATRSGDSVSMGVRVG